MARSICCLLFMVLLLMSTPTAFSASLTIDASLSRVYEDNINPLLSGAPRPFSGRAGGKKTLSGAHLNEAELSEAGASGTEDGDSYTVLSASGGASSVVGVETYLSIRAEASHTRYVQFTELDVTTAGLRLGLFKQFSDLNSAELTIFARKNAFREQALDGSTYAAVFEVRQQPSSRFQVGEVFSYEKNNARSALFSYAGRAFGIRSSYAFTDGLSAGLGYSCLFRRFESGVQAVLHSGSVNATWEPTRQFKLFGSFEHQRYETEPSHQRAENNISSLGIGFSY